MKNIKNKILAETGTDSILEQVDSGRRQALARLGLTAAIAYATPALLPLNRAAAASGPGHDGNGGGHSGESGGNDSSDGSDENSAGSEGSEEMSEASDQMSDASDELSDSADGIE